MIPDETREIYDNIIKVFYEQGYAVYFAVDGGMHTCYLSSTGERLFSAALPSSLDEAFKTWRDGYMDDKHKYNIVPF